MEIDAKGKHQRRHRACNNHGDLAAVVALFQRFRLALLGNALSLGPLAARLFLHRVFMLEDHRFHRGFVKAGKHIALEPAAAAAGILARTIGAAAHAHPHRALIAGIAQRVSACQIAQHIQSAAGRQGIGGILAYVARRMPPNSAILKPHLFDGKIKTLRLLAAINGRRHLKGAAPQPLLSLDALYLAGHQCALRVIARKDYL